MAKDENLNLEEVIEYIRRSSPESSILVAGDSIIERGKKYVKNGKKYKKPKMVNYITLVIVHIDSCHGGHIFRDVKIEPYDPSAKPNTRVKPIKHNPGLMYRKLLRETEHCIRVAREVVDSIGEFYNVKYKDGKKIEFLDLLDKPRDWGVHLDLNDKPSEASNAVAAAAIGWVKSKLGVTPTIKPDSFGATNVADHVARKLAG